MKLEAHRIAPEESYSGIGVTRGAPASTDADLMTYSKIKIY